MTDYERGYHQGYADAMNWKTQNHLEHLPGRQEPVAWWDGKESVVFAHDKIYTPNLTDYWTKPLYTTPPQRPWVGLTDDEIKEIIGPWGDTPIKGYTRKLFDQIEAKLKEKNT